MSLWVLLALLAPQAQAVLRAPSPVRPISVAVVPSGVHAAALAPALGAAPKSAAAEQDSPLQAAVAVPVVPAAPAEPAAPAPSADAAVWSALFDRSRLQEGEEVFPRLDTLKRQIANESKGVSPALAARISAVRAAVESVLPELKESVALSSWAAKTLDGKCCGAGAPRLALLLRAKGVPARLVEAAEHYYVVVDTPDGLIYVDPTVRQWFGAIDAPATVPLVFVGTEAELRELFQRHYLQREPGYGPDRVYFSAARVRERGLDKLLDKIRRSPHGEYAPLRRALGL